MARNYRRTSDTPRELERFLVEDADMGFSTAISTSESIASFAEDRAANQQLIPLREKLGWGPRSDQTHPTERQNPKTRSLPLKLFVNLLCLKGPQRDTATFRGARPLGTPLEVWMDLVGLPASSENQIDTLEGNVYFAKVSGCIRKST
jgi:hypothetical protein